MLYYIITIILLFFIINYILTNPKCRSTYEHMSNNRALVTHLSSIKIEPKINIVEQYFNTKTKFIIPDFRIYKTKKYIKTKYAFVTIIFGDEKYMPCILNFGYSLRLTNTKHNIICLVQDKPYTYNIRGENKTFPGINRQMINDILQIYDVVYGVDLLSINYNIPTNHMVDNPHYHNIQIYVTKIQTLGLIDYDKIAFFDASSIISKNIDIIFNYDKPTFRIDKEWVESKVGLHGSFFLCMPSLKIYTKAMFLINYYNKIFHDLYFVRGIDEIIIYYSIYPNWSDILVDKQFICHGKKYKSNPQCYAYIYMINKPFDNKYNNRFTLWDNIAVKLLSYYPQFNIYFNNINRLWQ